MNVLRIVINFIEMIRIFSFMSRQCEEKTERAIRTMYAMLNDLCSKVSKTRKRREKYIELRRFASKCNDKNSKETNKKPMKLIECQTSHNPTTSNAAKIDSSSNNNITSCPYALRAIRAGIPFIVNDQKSIN